MEMDLSTGIIVGLEGVVWARTVMVTDVGSDPPVKVIRVLGPSNAYGVEREKVRVCVTVPSIRPLPDLADVIVTEFAPVCIVP